MKIEKPKSNFVQFIHNFIRIAELSVLAIIPSFLNLGQEITFLYEFVTAHFYLTTSILHGLSTAKTFSHVEINSKNIAP